MRSYLEGRNGRAALYDVSAGNNLCYCGAVKNPRVPELVGVSEIGEMAGVSRQTVTNWRARYEDFPEPVADLKATPVFVAVVVRAWLKRQEARRAAERKRAAEREERLIRAREERQVQRLVDAWDVSQRKARR